MRAIKILQQTICPFLGFIHATRLNAVLWAVRSLLFGGRLSLTALGRSGAGSAFPKHAIKRVDRLLGNKKLHGQIPEFYKLVARMLIGGRRPVILVDWTVIGTKHIALVAAAPLDGRSLSIYLEVHPKRKDNNPKVIRRFLRALEDILPAKCSPVLVTDAGFKNTWFTEVASLGWDFEDARSNSAKRFEVLLLISTLGMLAVTLLGHAAETRGIHRRYQANTISTRRVLSLFYLGCALIRMSEDKSFTRGDFLSSLRELRKKLPCVEPTAKSFFVGIP